MMKNASKCGPNDEGDKDSLCALLIFPIRIKMPISKRGENTVFLWFPSGG
jgi:hypothetical protein